ncbi:hypothetical protein ALC57_00980 [Trachymyrmex cornetzi]|uniref:Uncharacterized protein n=1 Tax=Trachymyrmex cornetzi TaxID=471704 RepID=A0A195EPA3_9HYME|nr:hypothetical protein ALC57_00980 [Trachymyrmex cornetzi]
MAAIVGGCESASSCSSYRLLFGAYFGVRYRMGRGKRIPYALVHTCACRRVRSRETGRSFHNECRVLEDTVLREVMKLLVYIFRHIKKRSDQPSFPGNLLVKKNTLVGYHIGIIMGLDRVSYMPTSGIGRAPRCPIAVPSDYNVDIVTDFNYCYMSVQTVYCILTVTVKLSINDNSLSREAGSTTRRMSGVNQSIPLLVFTQRCAFASDMYSNLSCNMRDVRPSILLIALFINNCHSYHYCSALHCVLLRNDVELDSHGLQTRQLINQQISNISVKYGQTFTIRFKESINRAVRKRTSKGAKRERDGHISARSSIVQNLSGLRTTYPFTGYIASRRRRRRR